VYYSNKYKLFFPGEKDTTDIAPKRIHSEIPFLEHVLTYVKGRDVCIQAGGHAGIFPLRLAKEFKTVYTFEPDKENYKCLTENVKNQPNIVHRNVGLSSKEATLKFLMDKTPEGKDNSGSYFVEDQDYSEFKLDSFEADVITLDSTGIDHVDFLQLDVEGHEYDVFLGAEKLLRSCRPIIQFEANIYSKKPIELLSKWGYYMIIKGETDAVFKK
jgi:FkbM family methyltransferase